MKGIELLTIDESESDEMEVRQARWVCSQFDGYFRF